MIKKSMQRDIETIRYVDSLMFNIIMDLNWFKIESEYILSFFFGVNNKSP